MAYKHEIYIGENRRTQPVSVLYLIEAYRSFSESVLALSSIDVLASVLLLCLLYLHCLTILNLSITSQSTPTYSSELC